MNNTIPFSPKNGGPGCMRGKEVDVYSESKLESIRFFLTDYGHPEADLSYAIYRYSDRETPDIEINTHPEVRRVSS